MRHPKTNKIKLRGFEDPGGFVSPGGFVCLRVARLPRGASVPGGLVSPGGFVCLWVVRLRGDNDLKN